MTTASEYFEGRLDDGSAVTVVKQTASMPAHGDMDVLPSFSIEGGEKLTPVGDDLKVFVSIPSRQRVRIVGPRPGS